MVDSWNRHVALPGRKDRSSADRSVGLGVVANRSRHGQEIEDAGFGT